MSDTRSGNQRVVVTGMAAFSPIGNSWAEVRDNMKAGRNGVARVEDWAQIEGLHTCLGAPVTDFELPPHFTRKKTRTMGRVAKMATVASENALIDAGLKDDPVLKSGRAGVAYGSSTGSTDALADFAKLVFNHSTSGLSATTYIRMMGHTTAVNIGVYFGLQGRIINSSTACTSGSLGIGYAYENIRSGAQDIMIAGGAEELCPTEAAVFDTLYATSTQNDAPETTPRPFDRDRDGLVIGEGACTLILENRDHALARGARIHAEIIGFDTNTDGRHVTQPSPKTMQTVMESALQDAGISASEIDYISAHGTATDKGDVAESAASHQVYGSNTPISSMKSYVGHTLGACGSLEAWMAIEMMNENWFAPTLNCKNVDPLCAELDYILNDDRKIEAECIVNNNFAFGGINTSIIIRRHT